MSKRRNAGFASAAFSAKQVFDKKNKKLGFFVFFPYLSLVAFLNYFLRR